MDLFSIELFQKVQFQIQKKSRFDISMKKKSSNDKASEDSNL